MGGACVPLPQDLSRHLHHSMLGRNVRKTDEPASVLHDLQHSWAASLACSSAGGR